MNILTVDVEEWFHLLDHDLTKDKGSWSSHEVRIHKNLERILTILENTDTKATFFVLGWIAKKYPDVIKTLLEMNYDIGSHSFYHELVYHQNKLSFKKDVEYSIKTIEDISGKSVKYFRAPGFSITEQNLWAFDVLLELGIEIDCSIFPARHSHGGFPSYGKSSPAIIEINGSKLKQLPISFFSILNYPVVFSGGGYFRLFPYRIIKYLSKDTDYLMSYIHPRDLDPGQPIVPNLSVARRFKSYVGLGRAEKKLTKWLIETEFIDVSTANDQIDWATQRTIKIR